MVDIVVRPRGPHHPGSDTASGIVATPGGSAANQAVALSAAGAEAHLVASVGDDEVGRAAARALAAKGVLGHLRARSGVATGMVVALVGAEGQRSMYTDRGANLLLDEPALDEPGLWEAGRHLHLSGYVLLDDATRPAGLGALARARAAAMTTSVDPSSAGPLAAVGPEAFLRWCEGVDWLCANRDEGEILTGAEAPEEIAARLRQRFREVTLTDGSRGAYFSGPGPRVLHVAGTPVEVVDTTGAGDAFTGTFLAQRLGGRSPQDALKAGVIAGGAVVTLAGARGWH
jgi:sugar/nucleoside kinase (ribokinase family)